MGLGDNGYLPDSIKLESAPCPMGCPQSDEIMLYSRDKLHNLPGEFALVQCRTCGLFRTDPRPTLHTISYYYPDNYGPYGTTLSVPSGPLQKIIRKFIHHLIDFRTHKLPDLKPGRMLEIGCASGSFLHVMHRKGWHVKGVELSSRPAEAARALGYQVHHGPVESMPVGGPAFDLVVAWMVMEHLHDPVQTLRNLHRMSSPGAFLVLSVPDISSFEFRLFKSSWFALQLPNHLYHFDRRSLARLLETGGWSVEQTFHQRIISGLLASFAGLCHEKWPHKDALKRFYKWSLTGPLWLNVVLYPLAVLLASAGQSGRMVVWARRKEISS